MTSGTTPRAVSSITAASPRAAATAPATSSERPTGSRARRFSTGFSREIILFLQFKLTDDFYDSLYRRVFYSYYCRSEWLGIFLSWEYKEPSMQPTKAPLCSSLQQNVQPFLTQQSSSTY